MVRKTNILIVLLLSFFAATAQAHETKVDGAISVLLHMEPQDSPVVGEPATLFFAIEDHHEKFQFAECDCSITIKQKEQLLHAQKLTQQEESYGQNVGSLGFTFPKKGIYTIAIDGQPKAEEDFQAFHLDYNVRIERASRAQTPVDPLVRNEPAAKDFYRHYWLGIILVSLFAILIIVMQRLRRKK